MKVTDNLREAIKTGTIEKALEECGRVEDFIYSFIALGLVLIGLFVALAMFFAIMSVIVEK
jgi:hypothetical protein